MSARSVAAAVLAVALALSACGGPAHATRHHAHHSMPSTITYSQGASICNDINAWLSPAMNENQPRFTIQMQSDETQADTTSLGLDLGTLDTNLQQLNGAALFPSPPGYSPPTGLGWA